MAIGRNDNYVQWMFTADNFCKRRKEKGKFNGWTGFHVLTRGFEFCLIWESPWTGFHVLTQISKF
jgi:hypothetical protein